MSDSGVGCAAPVLELAGTSVGYDGRAVVRGVDLRVVVGEVVVVLGPNGSGKTTLVRGVLGLAQVLGGTMQLFGTPSERFRDRARIGYVPQRHTVAGAVPSTVREVVSSGRLARLGPFGRPGRADRVAVDRAIDTVGLLPQARESVGELSGGQQRRVLIARALASEPQLLVMDEPTAGVDASNQHALAATLAELAERGVTMLLVAHEVGPVAPLITRALVLHDGRISFDGDPAGVLPDLDRFGAAHHDELDGPELVSLVGDLRVGR